MNLINTAFLSFILANVLVFSFGDNLDEVLEDLSQKIEKEGSGLDKNNQNQNKFNNNDDPDLVLPSPANTKEKLIQKPSLTPSVQASKPDTLPLETTTKIASITETEASHYWTIFLILCILGKLNK